MVDAMGGPSSPHYNRFKSLCYTAFIGLRKNANLILNLIALMVDANIQDIRLEPDKAVLKVSDTDLQSVER
jgi:phosphatidylinositol 3-kinase